MLLMQAYGVEFLNRIKHKHTMAKTYFFRLPVMAEHMHASIQGTHAVNSAASVPTVSAKRIVQSSA